MYKRIIALMSVCVMVFLCSFPTFATTGNGAWSTRLKRINLPTRSYITLTALQPYETDIETFGQSYVRTWAIDVIGEYVIYNDNTIDDLMFTGTNNNKVYLNIMPYSNAPSGTPTQTWNLSNVEYIGGQLNISYIDSTNCFMFKTYNPDSSGSPYPIVIPKSGSVVCYFKLTYTLTPDLISYNNLSFQFRDADIYLLESGTYDTTLGDYHENYISYIPDIYDMLVEIAATESSQLSVLQQILASYNANVPISQQATSDAQSSQNTANSQHQVELSQFNNTNTALSNSGISNYHFNNEQVGGIGGVSNDFTSVFNSLGSWNQVYIFALTLSLALAIIRHIRPKRSQND